MDKLSEAIRLVSEKAQQLRKEEEWEDGYEVPFIFNDAVIILSKEDKEIGIKVIAGEPVYIDFNIDLLED